MLDLLDDGALQESAERIHEATEPEGAVVVVHGVPGAGRSRVERRLRRDDPQRYVVVHAPDASEPDAALHAALQAAKQMRARSDEIVDRVLGTSEMRSVGALLAKALEEEGDERVLVLRIPPSWSHGPNENERLDFGHHATALLRGFRDAKRLRIVVFTDTDAAHLRSVLRGDAYEAIRLPPPEVRPDALDDVSRWGEYASAATRVRDLLQRTHPRPTAFAVGIAIAVQALRPDARLRPSDLSRGLGSLLEYLDEALWQPHNLRIRDGLQRLATARFSVGTAAALDIGRIPAEHTTLVTKCVAYETEQGFLRMTDTIRAALARSYRQRHLADSSTHAELGRHFESRDGVIDPRSATAATILPWLEATHHFAWGGSTTFDHWIARARKSSRPELFWDRARALSIRDRNWEDSAAVYRECVRLFPQDHYGHHYLAWNLDRAGGSLEEIESSYRRAIQLDADNPWYNSRLVTFLIGTARYGAAEEEWQRALDRLDPQRMRGGEETLVANIHVWVASAWLEAGEVVRARRVFDSIDESLLDSVERLRDIAWRLEDAEEAMALGTSVYPSGVPPEDRWRKPHFVAGHLGDNELTAWYPMRIAGVSTAEVELELAIPSDAPDDREVFGLQVSRKDWLDMSGGIDPDAQRPFWILARYGSVTRVFSNDPGPAPWQRQRQRGSDPLRYLRQWAPRR